MTLCDKAVKILVDRGFDAVLSTGFGSLIIVRLPDKKIILHHFDVYDFLNKHCK